MAASTPELWPNKYSLWLVPDEGSAAKIGQVMQEETANYAGVGFPPHLTLLGHIGGDSQEQLSKAQQLAQHLRQIKVILDKACAGNKWLGACWVDCTLDAPLQAAAAAARSMYHQEGYWPHVSILYAETTQEQREECARRTQAKLTAAGVHDFTAAALEMWYTPTSCPKDIGRWKRVGHWQLAQAEP